MIYSGIIGNSGKGGGGGGVAQSNYAAVPEVRSGRSCRPAPCALRPAPSAQRRTFPVGNLRQVQIDKCDVFAKNRNSRKTFGEILRTGDLHEVREGSAWQGHDSRNAHDSPAGSESRPTAILVQEMPRD